MVVYNHSLPVNKAYHISIKIFSLHHWDIRGDVADLNKMSSMLYIHIFIMLFIFKDLTVIGEILRQAIQTLAGICLTDTNTCTVTEFYLSLWDTIGIEILCVHRFCKFGLGMWPSSFSAHEKWNWKETWTSLTLLCLFHRCISAFPTPLLQFVILPSKRNFIGVKWCQHFPLLICCAF